MNEQPADKPRASLWRRLWAAAFVGNEKPAPAITRAADRIPPPAEPLPAPIPDEIARKLALDEEVRQQAEVRCRYEEQKQAKQEAEEQQRHRDADALVAIIERWQQRGQQEAAERTASGELPKPAVPEVESVAQASMFPQWGDERRATAAALFRSALFPPLNFKKSRPFLKEAEIYATKGIEIYFTGQQFDQSDLDVYLELLHIAREVPFGVECSFTAHGMLKTLGRATGKANHEWLHSVLIRLRGGTIDMTDHKVRYFGGLIEGGFKDEITRSYRVSVNPKMAQLFRGDLWSSLDIQQRRALNRSQTAKAVHAYLSSHANPGPVRYETLAEIIGLKDKNPRKVKMKIITAYESLKEIGFLSDFEAGSDTITPKVNHTQSQQRHLVRKAIGGTRQTKRRKIDAKDD